MCGINNWLDHCRVFLQKYTDFMSERSDPVLESDPQHCKYTSVLDLRNNIFKNAQNCWDEWGGGAVQRNTVRGLLRVWRQRGMHKVNYST